jgi:hypothetical protein
MQNFPAYKKVRPRGEFGPDRIPSNRNIFMTKAIIQKERALTDHPSVVAPHQIAVYMFNPN